MMTNKIMVGSLKRGDSYTLIGSLYTIAGERLDNGLIVVVDSDGERLAIDPELMVREKNVRRAE